MSYNLLGNLDWLIMLDLLMATGDEVFLPILFLFAKSGKMNVRNINKIESAVVKWISLLIRHKMIRDRISIDFPIYSIAMQCKIWNSKWKLESLI